MRINLRIKIRGYTFFGMVSKTQTIKGITSKVFSKEKKHQNYIFWDLEGCTLEQAKETLANVQYEFRLGKIFIISDYPKSFRAFCFSVRDFKTYLHILLHTDFVDFNFLHWTVDRGYATIRTTDKKDRISQQLVSILEGYEKTETPKQIRQVIYDTGINKTGRLLQIG